MKPPRTHHCRICNACVLRMDHHCPWINNCVGRYNQKHFLQFLFLTVIGCLYSAIFLILQSLLSILRNDYDSLIGNPLCYWKFCFCKLHFNLVLYSIIVSVMFFIFSLDLLLDQLCCIAHNTSSNLVLTHSCG